MGNSEINELSIAISYVHVVFKGLDVCFCGAAQPVQPRHQGSVVRKWICSNQGLNF